MNVVLIGSVIGLARLRLSAWIYGAAMVDVQIEGDRAIFQVEGFDRLWSLRSRLEIPLSHILAVEANVDLVGRWWHGFKLIGTDVPGLLAAGMFYFHGELAFWDVHHPAKTIIVSLDHEWYKKLIVEVADPHETVAQLQAALERSRR
jgi:hypothetical protein